MFKRSSCPYLETIIPVESNVVGLLEKIQNRAPLPVVTEAVRRDVALQYRLVFATASNNNVFAGFSKAIAGIGYFRMEGWLARLLMTSHMYPEEPEAYAVAHQRGQAIRSWAERFRCSEEFMDNLHIVGAFSALDTIASESMVKVIAPLAINQEVRDALLGQESAYLSLFSSVTSLVAMVA